MEPKERKGAAEGADREANGQTIKGDGRHTRAELRHQTIKWLGKLEDEMKHVCNGGKLPKQQYDSLMENLNAYIKDTRHFMERGDMIRAFEACIYAWGILETARRVGIITNKK
ncbi:MAG: hypothetical protein DRO99_02770 [Candidatus Aenigmatarchaeota archaeon]|nr:MAG: hypothetical protein DRO99_02770 [Candidatus Aenigmarchaeota archaeon]